MSCRYTAVRQLTTALYSQLYSRDSPLPNRVVAWLVLRVEMLGIGLTSHSALWENDEWLISFSTAFPRCVTCTKAKTQNAFKRTVSAFRRRPPDCASLVGGWRDGIFTTSHHTCLCTAQLGTQSHPGGLQVAGAEQIFTAVRGESGGRGRGSTSSGSLFSWLFLLWPSDVRDFREDSD